MESYNFKITNFLKWKYTEEQLCVYFLSKNIRSIYHFDDDFIVNWYKDIFGSEVPVGRSARQELILFYTKMLMTESKYEAHLEYWVEKSGSKIFSEVEEYFMVESSVAIITTV